MKKYLLTLLCSMFALVLSARENPVKFVSGDFSVLKNPENVLAIELDMSKAKLEDSGKSWNQFIKDGGPDYVRDWPDEKKKLEDYFWVMYNRKNKKGAHVDREASNPKYKIIVRPGVIDLGNRAAAAVSMFVTSFAKGGECYIRNCEIIVVKTSGVSKSKSSKKGSKTSSTGATVATYTAGEIKGGTSLSETIRVGTVLSQMGKKFGQLVSKQ